jgi:hypothetical protein
VESWRLKSLQLRVFFAMHLSNRIEWYCAFILTMYLLTIRGRPSNRTERYWCFVIEHDFLSWIVMSIFFTWLYLNNKTFWRFPIRTRTFSNFSPFSTSYKYDSISENLLLLSHTHG